MKKRKLLIAALLIIPLFCTAKVMLYRFRSMWPLDVYLAQKYEYNQRGEHHEMARMYQKFVDAYPDRPDLFYDLGWAYYKIGKTKKGAYYMKQYVQANPYYPPWKTQFINAVRKAARNGL